MWTQRRMWCIVSLVIAAWMLASPFAAARDKKTDDKTKADKKPAPKPLLTKAEELTENDEKDTHEKLKNSPRKVYKMMFEAGKTYQIDLKSKDFDSVLRVEDPAGKAVAINDYSMATF